MDELTYQIEAQLEATHWWFVSRRKLLSRIIRRLRLAPDAPVLDLGTSTGTNLRMLQQLNFRNAVGLDNSHEAIRYCAEKGLGKVEYGDLCALPFENGRFDLVLATDVIEHVDDDGKALTEVARVLRPGGIAVITVPAFQSLWGVADEVGHHKRRYRKAQLAARIHAAGLECPELFYFNYLLFLPIWLARQIIRIRGIRVENENQVNTPLLNRILTSIFSLDVWSARYVRPPFGVSILALAHIGAGTAKEK